MFYLAQIIGFIAVAAFLLSYQQKKRKNIIIFNTLSRVLYIVQYVMLGQFSGAVLDVLGALSSVAAQQKNRKFIRKYYIVVVIIIDLVILAAGLYLDNSLIGMFPIVGVILHTTAFWIDDEKKIRAVSFLGSPFWFVYNLLGGAYFSALGDILSMVSIGIAIYRYDIKPKNK